MKKNLKLVVLLLVGVVVGLTKPESVHAIEAWAEGKVYVTVDGRRVPIPGVIVIREDRGENDRCCNSPGCCWGINRGPFSQTNSDGKYKFSYNSAIGNSTCGGHGSNGAMWCKGMEIGNNTSAATCDADRSGSPYFDPGYHCGLSCGDGSPQRWLAYFPPNFNKSVLPAGVYFVEGNMKGGGSWKVTGGGSDGNVSIGAGSGNWDVSAANFGNVTYQSQEWYQATTAHNAGGLGNLNIEWLPTTETKATFSGSCEPSINGSNRHVFSISGVQGGDGNLESTTLFISFVKDAASEQIRGFLGEPTWITSNGNWYGYFLSRKTNLGKVNAVTFDAIDNNSNIASTGKTWGDLALYLEENAGAAGSSIPENYVIYVDANVKMAGVPQLDGLNRKPIELRKYTCTSPPAPMCHSINVVNGDLNNPRPGDSITFSCDGQLDGSVITQLPADYHYDFRIYDGNNVLIGASSDFLSVSGNQATLTIPVDDYGAYTAQCAVCNQEGNCDWEPADSN